MTTGRLLIEELQPRHAALLFDGLREPRQYDYIPGAPPASARALADRYARMARGAPEGSNAVWLNWALRRVDTGDWIGTLQATVSPGEQAYIAYQIAPAHQRRGYATEACRWLLADLPARCALPALVATVDVRNQPSIRLLERLGFVCLGTEPAELRGEATLDYRYRLELPSVSRGAP